LLQHTAAAFGRIPDDVRLEGVRHVEKLSLVHPCSRKGRIWKKPTAGGPTETDPPVLISLYK
jgi:hypothetical protein